MRLAVEGKRAAGLAPPRQIGGPGHDDGHGSTRAGWPGSAEDGGPRPRIVIEPAAEVLRQGVELVDVEPRQQEPAAGRKGVEDRRDLLGRLAGAEDRLVEADPVTTSEIQCKVCHHAGPCRKAEPLR